MILEKQFDNKLTTIILNGISEDIGKGDYRFLVCIASTEVGKAKLLVKEERINFFDL